MREKTVRQTVKPTDRKTESGIYLKTSQIECLGIIKERPGLHIYSMKIKEF